MGKLSKEAWTVAFYEVMNEPLPPTGDALTRVGEQLAAQKVEADKKLKAAKGDATLARQVADDREQRRQQAGVIMDEEIQATLIKERQQEARDRYKEVADAARGAEEDAKRARIAQKEAEYAAKQIESQISEVKQRTGKGDVDGLTDDLKSALQQAQLQQLLERHEGLISEYDEKARLADNLSDKEHYAERIETSKDKRDTILALLPGFEIKPADPAHADELNKTVERMQVLVAKANETQAGHEKAAQGKQAAVDDQRQQLDAAASKDPKLAALCTALTEKRGLLTVAKDHLAEDKQELASSEAKLKECQTVLDAYASGSNPQPDPQDVDTQMMVLQPRIATLGRDRAVLRTSQDTLRKAVADVEAAERELSAAIETRANEPPENPELKAALAAVQAAQDELKRARSVLDQSKQETERLQIIADEAQRRLTVANTMPVATKSVAEFNGALAGIENTPIWDGSTELRTQLGAQNYDRLVALATKLTNDHETLVKNGASIEELKTLYKDTPDLWKPPQFREEERNWVSMKDLVDEEVEDKFRKEAEEKLSLVDKRIEAAKSKLEQGETIAGVIVAAMKGGEAGEGVLPEGALKSMAEALAKNKDIAEMTESVISLAGKIGTLAQAPFEAAEAGQKSMTTEDPVEALMLQDEFMESLGKLFEALTGGMQSGYKGLVAGKLIGEITTFLPAIGVPTSAAKAMTGLVESAARIQEAMDDADAHAEAEQSEHRASGAIGQFTRRDKHLAARAASRTGIAVIKTAAAVTTLSGAGSVVGVALTGVATAASLGQSAGEFAVDRSEGQKARDLLDRAQAGDGHARAELFSYHPRYAKGILSVLASEGDPMALRVLSTHGLTEDMIQRSSPKIIKRYLMKKFGETDDPGSWTGLKESIVSALDKVAGTLTAVQDFFTNKVDKLLARFDTNDLVAAQARLSELAYQLPGQEVSTAVTSLAEIRRRRETLAEAASEAQAVELKVVDAALAKEIEETGKVRAHVLTSLGTVREVIEKIGRQEKTPLRDKAEDAAKAVLREHLARLQELSRAA